MNGNRELTSLPKSLLRISTLEKVVCDDCYKLTSPPRALCKQGVQAVKKYFDDLKLDKASNQRLIPVTVIGKSRAGKTSLVKSMQKNERVLTKRSPVTGKLDEATKVFKVCEAEVDDTSKLVFADFGGQSIYHFAYQLTFKVRCVPFLVIDIADFDRQVAQDGGSGEAACQDVCMEWLSDLYVACPKLECPVVVLTHRDEIADNDLFNQQKQQLTDITEGMRERIIQSEEIVSPSSPVFTMTSFADRSSPLLRSREMLVFSTSSSLSDINALKETLAKEGRDLLTEVPGNWYRVLADMAKKNDEPFITISDVKKMYPNEKDPDTILEYLHDIGCIMWFKTNTKLSDFIFHRPEVLTELIELLYSHTQEENWTRRVQKFIPITHNDQNIEKTQYEEMVVNYTTSGIMESALLHNLLKNESKLQLEVALEVLKTFRLIYLCGPRDDAIYQKFIIISIKHKTGSSKG